jgi:hypothetical protein
VQHAIGASDDRRAVALKHVEAKHVELHAPNSSTG